MNEIVTGSHGFCGSYLKKEFERNNKTFIPLSRKLLSRPKRLRWFLEKHQPFRIYYLAAYGNLHGQEDVHEIYNAIIEKLLNVLEAAKGLDCHGIVVAGSTSEYGVKDKPMREDMILNPTSIYGAAKAGATHLAQAWAIQYNMPIVIYRPASITGVGEQSIHLIPKIIRSCIDQEPMNFIAPPTHDYIAVEDVVRAIQLLGEVAKDHRGEVFNVSTGKQWTNGEVLEIIEKYAKKKANIIGKKELRTFEASEMWLADNSKMKKLGWKPTITLKKTLERMVASYVKRSTEALH